MRKIENKTQQSNRKHTFVASMAMAGTAATSKAMFTMTAKARTMDAIAVTVTSTTAANLRERPGWDASKVGHQTQQSAEFAFVTSSSGGRKYLMRAPAANHRPAASAAAVFAGLDGQAGTGGA